VVDADGRDEVLDDAAPGKERDPVLRGGSCRSGSRPRTLVYVGTVFK
jgi:hypothetical protein